MTMDKMLHKVRTFFILKLSILFYITAIVLILSDLKAILDNISGVKYHFVVCFLIGHVYNKVKYKQILLNALKYTSLDSLFYLKRKLCLIGIKLLFLFQIKCISSD